jgi:hypothetical protein
MPLEWWQAIPPGADLQSLPSRFLGWFLRDQAEAAGRSGLAISPQARSALESIANVHLRVARAGAAASGEWEAARASIRAALKQLDGGEENPAWPLFEMAELLAWPVPELEDAISSAIGTGLQQAVEASIREAYTPEQWAEYLVLESAVHEKFLAARTDDRPEVLAEYESASELFEPHVRIRETQTAKALSAYCERLHTGLMRALADSVAGA